MSNKKNSSTSIVWWIIVFIALVIILYFVLRLFFVDKVNIIDWISVYGGFTTLFSLVLMFVQFKSIRKVSEETKNKLNKTVALSDLSKYSELIRSVEIDVRNNKIDVALYKTQNIKAIVHKLRIIEQNGNKQPDDEFESIISYLATHINSYNDQLLSEEPILNKSIILKELEEVTSFFQNKSNEMINNI